MSINNKKLVLFISLSFFGYEKSIKEAIEQKGYIVDFFDERASNNTIFKAVSRVKKEVVGLVINRYYNNILQKIKHKKYDYFLLIKGEAIPEKFVLQFKKLNPQAHLIFYNFDAIRNNKNSLKVIKHFDDCYTFDFEDAKKYPFFKLKHLFYSREYHRSSKEAIQNRKFDISFVGTLHSNRYSIIKSLYESFTNRFIFFYLPAKWLYPTNKLIKKEYKLISKEEVSFNKISKDEVANIFRASKCVIDIQRFHQTGLTMRTFEVLASGSILVTTNHWIKETEFYDPNYIVVLENIQNVEDKVTEIKEKIKKCSINTGFDELKFEKYYINNWIDEFFKKNC